jgi:hemerythrin-like metal-binding protein
MIKWNDRYSVNIPSIDEEHKELFGIIGELGAALKEGESDAILGETLDRLVLYAGKHFDNEEKLFSEHNYPQKDEHQATHNEFIQKLSEYNDIFHKGSNIISVQLIGFLSDWLVKHIMREDQQYAKFLAEIKTPATA